MIITSLQKALQHIENLIATSVRCVVVIAVLRVVFECHSCLNVSCNGCKAFDGIPYYHLLVSQLMWLWWGLTKLYSNSKTWNSLNKLTTFALYFKAISYSFLNHRTCSETQSFAKKLHHVWCRDWTFWIMKSKWII